LDLVEVLRHVAVALDLATRDVGDDLLVGRAEVVVAALAILDAKERVAEAIPAARLLEVLARQKGRHQDLERAGAVHLLAHDVLDLLEDAQAERQEIVHPGADLADEAGAREKEVADVGRVLRRFLDRRDERAREEHGTHALTTRGSVMALTRAPSKGAESRL